MYKQGDVVLIKMHPASGAELKKFRPAIIVQHYSPRDFITFIPLSSQVNKISLDEVLIAQTNNNNLEKPSLALCWYVQTVGAKRIQKTIGKLSVTDKKRVSAQTKKYLNL